MNEKRQDTAFLDELNPLLIGLYVLFGIALSFHSFEDFLAFGCAGILFAIAYRWVAARM